MFRSVRMSLMTFFCAGWAAQAALAAPERTYVVSPASTASYFVTHPLHDSEGISHRLTGTLKVSEGTTPDLVLPIQLSVPINSFLSGNRNRDRNMLTTMDAARYPLAVLRVTEVQWKRRQNHGERTIVDGEGSGQLAVHGQVHPVRVQLSGTADPRQVVFTAHFSFSLSEYGIKRPALFFQPVGDRVKMDVTGVAARQ